MENLVKGLVNDPEIVNLFSAEKELALMIKVEAALAQAQAENNFITKAHGDHLKKVFANFQPDISSVRIGLNQDGVAVPALVEQLRNAVGTPYAQSVHKGATSQDIIDTTLMLQLKYVFNQLEQVVAELVQHLEDLRQIYGKQTYIAHTRMQIALPMLLSDKLENWIEALKNHQHRLHKAQSTLFAVQSGGAVGNNAVMGRDSEAIIRSMALQLDLVFCPSWQTDRSRIVDIAEIFCLLCGTLGKIGQDIALMAQNEVHSISLAQAGRSSSMPHKNNPVKAEILVAIARLQAGLLGTIAQSMVFENERSGAAWTLEWLVLPNMAIASGGALRQAKELFVEVTFPKAEN